MSGVQKLISQRQVPLPTGIKGGENELLWVALVWTGMTGCVWVWFFFFFFFLSVTTPRKAVDRVQHSKKVLFKHAHEFGIKSLKI